ncbi:MAG: hypothetical protein PHX51_02425 [Clostridia bacterium]|nr:hypothetical protein [Clostridia bacterium]
MKVYYLLNDNNEIIQDDYDKFNENCQEIEKSDYYIVNGYNGAIFLLEYTKTEEYAQKAKAFKEKSNLEYLRTRRDEECFSIINRGTLWYNRLTQVQKSELEIWYNEWLDVTETLVVPQRPIWLKNL